VASPSTDSGLLPLFTTQFSMNMELLLQQKGSKLRGKVAEGFHVGRMASPINQVGAVTMKAPVGRFATKAPVFASLSRPWVFPIPGEIDQYIDTFDELQTICDPKNSYTEAAANAAGRYWDDGLIANATGTTQRGVDASSLTAETFTASTFQISATFGTGGTASGLTVAKMIEAQRLLRKYHNDLEMDAPTMVVGSQQAADLLSNVQFVSTEFNDRPVLVDGQVKRFLGFDIVISERLPQTTVGTTRGVLVFVKSGLYLGVWKDTENRIFQRPDLSGNPWDISTTLMYGAVRTQLGKVFQILCADTTGADITP
jgi:hypothetical protein